MKDALCHIHDNKIIISESVRRIMVTAEFNLPLDSLLALYRIRLTY